MALEIKNLQTSIGDKNILKNFNLKVNKGEVHVIMGPNGSGKSTLSYTIMGHPKYHVDSGEIIVDEEKISTLNPDLRAKKGLFLGFQHPEEIPGITVANFLRTAIGSVKGEKIPVIKFQKILNEKMKDLEIDESFSKRYLNEGFSGGEKKRCEILQMALLEPKYCILDEIDSGTDVDALKIIANGINKLMNKDRSFVIITHYNRILQHLKKIDYVHILIDGKIVKSGGKDLAIKIDKEGYENIS
ncbi:Fe-S cluster assembly ATPase SufC [Candidatus Woesearchaeota archaeon CG10_big_fil_rev_8_21_14_0_10_34_8]|nr:MAG: Fe-S cluster assembly ATPase SufC [Candidatus Woesearchaeota archaeon CG10_big_fil_rev_8_21_14_0_10_34_8]